MKLRIFGAVCVTIITVFFSTITHAATVTFEEVPVSGIGSTGQVVYAPGKSLESNGLVLTPTYTSHNIAVNGAEFIDARSHLKFASNGTNILSSFTDSGEFSFTISSANTQYFSLTSVDLARYGSTSMPSDLDSVMVRGHKHDGSTLNQVFDLNIIPDGAGGHEDFEMFVFDNTWKGLSFVEFGPANGPSRNIFYIDNIVYETPIPAAVWLFGSGLIGLIGFARRKA